MPKKEQAVEKKEPIAVDQWEGFEMMNKGKYDRAVEAVGNSDDKRAVLVEYDRLGGFIRYNGGKVLPGAFWDARNKRPVENPEPKVLRRQAAFVEETVEVAKVEAPKRGRKTTTEAEAEETE